MTDQVRIDHLASVLQDARTATSLVGSYDPVLAAALVNYQAAQILWDKLNDIQSVMSDLNENLWRSRQK